ncbi:LuxR C-terminal-related transcriptional regulator [Microbacterium foliorum]|uniref:LuxR C-terminal-related transcriptional regulator n=1 Tax=Microbacterium foliorum TaxID=104336 RepID=UPI0028D06732|nr:LuxR C-terminal-related transcriptional regulator [Microbacterium foliorum]
MRQKTARVLAEAAYAAGSAQGASTAREVLTMAAGVTHHEAAALIVWDESKRQHHDLLSDGYSPQTLLGLGDRYAGTSEHRRMLATRYPLRIDDLPYDYRKSDIFHEVMEPGGFAEGMSACLFAAGGSSYRGMLHFSASSAGSFDDEAVELVAALTPIIAQLCSDMLLPSQSLPSSFPTRASVIDHEGRATAVEAHEPVMCVQQPTFQALLRQFRAAEVRSIRGVWPSAEGWLAIEIQKAWDGYSASSPTIRIEERALGAPFGLSHRELDILQGIARGESNQQIALARAISTRTVTTHVERLLKKTAQPSRAGLVALAARQGLLTLTL